MEELTELNYKNSNLILKRIRADTNDVYNRLHSIHEDSQFVSSVADAFPDYPLFGTPRFKPLEQYLMIKLTTANQRCGAWYTDRSKVSKKII